MKFAIASVALFVAMAVGQTLQINTPANVVECQPTLLTWGGGTPPYFLSILPGNSPGSAALQDLGQQTGTSYTWSTNLAAGTSIGLTLRDSTGAIAQSAAFTINPGTTTCIGASSSAGSSSAASSSSSGSASSAAGSSSSSSSSAAVSSQAGTTTPAATVPAATATKPATTSSGSKTSSASSAATSSSGAGRANVANMGIAGVIGAAVIAVLA